jgi:hypothetical protein
MQMLVTKREEQAETDDNATGYHSRASLLAQSPWAASYKHQRPVLTTNLQTTQLPGLPPRELRPRTLSRPWPDHRQCRSSRPAAWLSRTRLLPHLRQAERGKRQNHCCGSRQAAEQRVGSPQRAVVIGVQRVEEPSRLRHRDVPFMTGIIRNQHTAHSGI